MIVEYGVGHLMRGSAPMSFAKINPHEEWLGWWTVIFVMFGIVLYYAVVIAWCVCDFWFSLDLAWGADPQRVVLSAVPRRHRRAAAHREGLARGDAGGRAHRLGAALASSAINSSTLRRAST